MPPSGKSHHSKLNHHPLPSRCHRWPACDITNCMRKIIPALSALFLMAPALFPHATLAQTTPAQTKPAQTRPAPSKPASNNLAQAATPGKRLWVLRATAEMVEYDLSTFAVKHTLKVPVELASAPQNIAVNREGQLLVAPPASLPLAENDLQSPHKIWMWDGRTAATLDQGLKREVAATGSNFAVSESAPLPYLASDGQHLYWFANSARRLQRDEVDLSTTTAWQAWRTGPDDAGREDLAAAKVPDCRCPTGACEETCPYTSVWTPESGVSGFFLTTQSIAAKGGTAYKSSTLYREQNGNWAATPLADPLHRVLDAASSGTVIVEAIPDTGCCGWSNESNDQTLVHMNGKTLTVFDEQTTYKNSDYDVSFFTSNARLSPELGYVAMTISATANVNDAIQLSEQGQANPEESKQIRRALADLPAVEVRTLADPPRRAAFLPHAALVGWINEKELLIVEDHLLVVLNAATGIRRKSSLRVDDAAHVFLR